MGTLILHPHWYPLRLTADQRYGADGRLTFAGDAQFDRNNLAKLAMLFRPGDVVFDEEMPEILGIVTERFRIGLDIVWEHGGRMGGPAPNTWHREPRVNVPVTTGMLGHRWWNRRQAVMAALRKAGLR